nr:hypothetical protein [Microctonus hyperodae filamentous virus]
MEKKLFPSTSIIQVDFVNIDMLQPLTIVRIRIEDISLLSHNGKKCYYLPLLQHFDYAAKKIEFMTKDTYFEFLIKNGQTTQHLNNVKFTYD